MTMVRWQVALAGPWGDAEAKDLPVQVSQGSLADHRQRARPEFRLSQAELCTAEAVRSPRCLRPALGFSQHRSWGFEWWGLHGGRCTSVCAGRPVLM